MARPLRIEYPGAWYHVMNRGAGRRIIYPGNPLRESFLDLLQDIYERYAVCCHAYCLMDNHYHLLVQTKQANLGRAMRHLDGVYTQRHNRSQETDGPLFRGRYKAQLIERDSYLHHVGRYIHRNPIEAGLCERLVDYPWSSYAAYLGLSHPPYWLQIRDTLAIFGTVGRYCLFVERGGDKRDVELSRLMLNTKGLPILGSEKFKEPFEQQRSSTPDYELSQAKTDAKSSSLIEIESAVCACKSVAHTELLSPSTKEGRMARALAMWYCFQHGGYRLREIAEHFDVGSYTTSSTIIRRFRRFKSSEAALRVEGEKVRSWLKKMSNG